MPATAPHPERASLHLPRPRRRRAVAGVLVLVAAIALPASLSGAATAVGLGTAGSFSVIGSSTVTNTGPSILEGDLGLHPGTSVTGFDPVTGPGIVNGDVHIADKPAERARADARTADGALAGQACDATLTGQDLGGLTLTPGVYCFASSAQLTGALTLDAEGDPAAAFVFQIGSTLTTASSSRITVTNGLPCNVFWQVGSSATLGTDTAFVGTLIAGTSITATTGATVEGRLLALDGAVTLDTNVITMPACPPPPDDTPPDDTPPGDTPPDVDTPPDEDAPTDEDAPVDETPVDETPEDDSPTGSPPPGDTDGPTGETTSGNPAVPPGLLTSGPAAPGTPGGPAVPTAPGVPAGPATPGGPGGPAAPRPPLARTGSADLVLGGIALLTILTGCALIGVADAGHRISRGRPPAA